MTKNHNTIVGRGGRTALRLLSATMFSVAFTGCYQSALAQTNYPDDYRERHPITVTEGERSVEVFVSRNRGGLTPVQRGDVFAFARAWQHEAMSGIIIDVPSGGPADRAATASAREIESVFSTSGVPRKAILVRHYRPAGGTLTSIRLSYAKLTARAGPCGLWPKDLGPAGGAVYLENKPYWNLGCATQRNLAAMVDNPADLIQPRGEAPTYSNQRSAMFEKFRKGESPSTNYKGYDTGKISDLGK